jgi:hypothetical protein
MAYGGSMKRKKPTEYPGGGMIMPQKRITQMGNGGYKVTRSSERKGKTHKVTGPDGSVKFFGDPNLKNRPNNPEAKKSWYARHKKSLAKNPHFRAYARSTWGYGGKMDEYAYGGDMDYAYGGDMDYAYGGDMVDYEYGGSYKKVGTKDGITTYIDPVTGKTRTSVAKPSQSGKIPVLKKSDGTPFGQKVASKVMGKGGMMDYTYGGNINYQKGGKVSDESVTPEMKAYLDALAFNKEARQAIGTNDTEKLNQLRLDKPYNYNDLARDFSELQKLRQAAGLGVVEEASILFPHVGQQMRGTVNQILGTHYAQGGSFDNPGFKALPVNVQNKIMKNSMKNGGMMDYQMGGQLTEFQGGGTHQENPNGGIPQGPDASVEEGETKMNAANYIFSDRLTVPKDLAKELQMPFLKGKTFAAASKAIKKKYDPQGKKETDLIVQNAIERELKKLIAIQEVHKADLIVGHQKEIMDLKPDASSADLMMMPEGMPQEGAPQEMMPQDGMQMGYGGMRKKMQPGGLVGINRDKRIRNQNFNFNLDDNNVVPENTQVTESNNSDNDLIPYIPEVEQALRTAKNNQELMRTLSLYGFNSTDEALASNAPQPYKDAYLSNKDFNYNGTSTNTATTNTASTDSATTDSATNGLSRIPEIDTPMSAATANSVVTDDNTFKVGDIPITSAITAAQGIGTVASGMSYRRALEGMEPVAKDPRMFNLEQEELEYDPIDSAPYLAMLDAEAAQAQSQIMDVAGKSPGTTLANIGSLAERIGRAKATTEQDLRMRNEQLKQQTYLANLRRGMFDKQMEAQVTDWNDQDLNAFQSALLNFKSTQAQNLATSLTNLRREQAAKDLESGQVGTLGNIGQ